MTAPADADLPLTARALATALTTFAAGLSGDAGRPPSARRTLYADENPGDRPVNPAPATDADLEGAALLRLELIGGVLSLAAKMCGDFARQHDGCNEPCCYPMRSRNPPVPDEFARDEARLRTRRVSAAGLTCGWAAKELNDSLPTELTFRDASDADALRILAGVARRL